MKDGVNSYLRSVSTPGGEYELSEATVRQYGYVLKKLLRYLGEDAKICDVGEERVRGFIDSLVKKGLSRSSLVQSRSCMRSFYSFLYEEGFSTQDISNAIRSRSRGRGKRRSKPLPVHLTAEEYEEFSSVLSGRYLVISDMLYCTGLRISELLSLTPADVNIEERMLTVRGKGGKVRRVFVVEKLLLRPVFPGFEELMQSTGYESKIFSVTPRRIQQIFEDAMNKCGIEKKVTPHKLRHTFATRMVSEGVRTEIVQQLLGHESISTTQIYARVTQHAVLQELSSKELL